MIAALGEGEKARIDGMITTFDKFCIAGNKLENDYNNASAVAQELSSLLADFLFKAEKNQDVDVRGMVKEAASKIKRCRNVLLSRPFDAQLDEYAQILARKAGAAFAFFGGAEDCERKMLGVGGDEAPESDLFPLVCLKVAPRNARFASPIAHRDVLGSLMGLGIERELIGDIVVRDEGAYIFCTDKMAHFISTSLVKIGNTDVNCVSSDAPEGNLRNYREVRVQVTSPRADAIVAHLFRLSRGDAQTLFRQGKIMVDDSPCERTDYTLKENQVLSVRGYGRARYVGVENISKKGKSNLLLLVYA
jgi:RNA-binding protein YlmH